MQPIRKIPSMTTHLPLVKRADLVAELNSSRPAASDAVALEEALRDARQWAKRRLEKALCTSKKTR